MTVTPPRRPWWRRKRWRVAIAGWLILPAAYTLSLGPALYGVARGWVRHDHRLQAFYEPLSFVGRRSVRAHRAFERYATWWYLLGERHAESD